MALDGGIDITAQQREIILALFDSFLPSTQTWVYGSRVTGSVRPSSDLDMVVFASPEQSTDVPLNIMHASQ